MYNDGVACSPMYVCMSIHGHTYMGEHATPSLMIILL